jgi:hypothetical protein
MVKKSNANIQVANRPLNKAEQQLYNRLKRSFKQIKLYQEGKIELNDARTLLSEL